MKKLTLCILFIICSIFNIQAEFNLEHKPGLYNELMENGMQAVHTETQIVYAKPGEWVNLYRVDRAAFISYVRWYCYDTDRAIPKYYLPEDSVITDELGNFISCTRIESMWEKDTLKTNPKFKTYNEYGWFAYDYASDRVTTTDVSYIEIKYRMHKGDSIYRIACDESLWIDDFKWNDTLVTEPTLSKRVIYEIHPAHEIAEQVELCKDSDGTNNRFLEEHEMIAPTERQLYIGPNYMYRGSGKRIKLQQYHYYSRSNYYYINSQGNVTNTVDDSKWKWYKNGVYDSNIKLNNLSSQFVAVSNSSPDTVIYELKYNPSTGIYFNIARFRIIYIDKNIVGPVKSLQVLPKIDKIYEQTFNFEQPNTTKIKYWLGHLDVDESTYGYYNKNLDNSPSYRKIRKGNVTWSEYAITNRKEMWTDNGDNDQNKYLYQHVDSIANIEENAKYGYMLYCDGSQQPGLVFNLNVNTNLCPGSTMYFSAWIADASSKRTSSAQNRSAPNVDFIVSGIDKNGNEHIISTFTTGEFGINADIDTTMNRGIWYQILFPVKFTTVETYPSYRLRITNKSTSSDGNDFAIDDIRIYVQKPPVRPIQASTYNCPSGLSDSITTYLRVDYQSIDINTNIFYYQWRNEINEILKLNYFNVNNDSTYGIINIPKDEQAIIDSRDTCSSLLAFDAECYNTKIPLVKYVKEFIDNTTERYVMYIAQPMFVRTNFNYTGYVTAHQNDLGTDNECGTHADLLIAGGTRILINDKALGDSVTDICGNREYKLDIVLTYIEKDSVSGELVEKNTQCKADWLIGDSMYVNNNINIYRYNFNEIEFAVEDYRKSAPLEKTKQIINHLLKNNLLVLDTCTTTIEPSIALSYTAFPVDGSASNGMSVCLTPRFLYLTIDDIEANMMVVGNKDDELPTFISDKPRIVRISSKQQLTGNFDLPLYLAGSEDEQYIIDSIYIISSTAHDYDLITLKSNKDTIALIDTINLSSDKLINLTPGYDYTFHIAFIGESSEDKCDRGYTYFTLRIIPDIVTWQGGTWNEDDNWDTFIPMKDTHVILLSNKDYNVMFNDSSIAKYDINYTENECDNIYFPDGASMAGQQYIIINGIAYIDIKEYAWKWTLTSIPIQGVVTGDLFISVNESTDPFIVAPINQIVGNYAEDRVKWQLYHKEYDADKDKWKSATNTPTRLFVAGDANMIGIDCETNDVNPIIRLPKQDNMYHYYEKNQLVWLPECDYIERISNYGKPVWNRDTVFILKQVFDNIYLLGNPTFGYINISKLIDDNSDKLTGRYYLEAEGAEKIPKKNEMIEFNHSIDDGENAILLPPYRGILLEGKFASDNLIINIDSSKVNPTGRQAPKRNRNANIDIATDIQNININNIIYIYDVMGRSYINNLNQLSEGIYIIRSENKIYKIYLKR